MNTIFIPSGQCNQASAENVANAGLRVVVCDDDIPLHSTAMMRSIAAGCGEEDYTFVFFSHDTGCRLLQAHGRHR